MKLKRIIAVIAIMAFLQVAALAAAQRRRADQTSPGSGSGTSLPRPAPDEVLPSFNGTLRGMDDKVLILERPDSNTMEFHCTRKTRYYDGANKVKPSAIAPGDRVSVEAKRAPDGSLDAVNVRLERRKGA